MKLFCYLTLLTSLLSLSLRESMLSAIAIYLAWLHILTKISKSWQLSADYGVYLPLKIMWTVIYECVFWWLFCFFNLTMVLVDWSKDFCPTVRSVIILVNCNKSHPCLQWCNFVSWFCNSLNLTFCGPLIITNSCRSNLCSAGFLVSVPGYTVCG